MTRISIKHPRTDSGYAIRAHMETQVLQINKQLYTITYSFFCTFKTKKCQEIHPSDGFQAQTTIYKRFGVVTRKGTASFLS